MKTLLLDQSAWDLVLDANGDVAVANDPYSLAQDAASAIRTFQGEVYYDLDQGVPYFAQILGRYPPAQVIKAALVKAALTVPGVASATCYLQALEGRRLTGQVQITSTAGEVISIGAPVTPQAPGQLNFSDPQQSGWISR